MSWNFREVDQREEIAQLKQKFSVQDAKFTSLEDQLLKKTTELQELRQSFQENVQKLRTEADRALQLEAGLKSRAEELTLEKVTRQNVENSLSSLKERLKEETASTRQLQGMLEALSQDSGSFAAQNSQLTEDKAKLETRVRELEHELKRSAFNPPAVPKPVVRPRTSSLSNIRIVSLERELSELQTASNKWEQDRELMKERLVTAQDDLVQVENEKIAMERRQITRLKDLEARLEEQEEELVYLRSRAESGSDSADLEFRLEEAERRVAALEADRVLLLRESDRLKSSLEQASEYIAREADLRADAEAKLAARAAFPLSRDMHASSPDKDNDPQDSDYLAEDSAARLLSAVERLRKERDSLRRDLEFVQVESQFTIGALRQQVASAIPLPPSPSPSVTPTVDVEASTIGRLTSGVQALLVVIQHLSSEKEEIFDDWQAAYTALNQSTEELQELQVTRLRISEDLTAALAELTRKDAELQEREERLNEAESSSEALREELQSVQRKAGAQVVGLQEELRSKEREIDEHGQQVTRLEGLLGEKDETLREAEEQRKCLTEQCAELQACIASLRLELESAQSSYQRLQGTIATGDGTRALKDQVATLEGRVSRRTEQIGIHQHDIKKLEANLRLAEERIEEMASELELATTEKAAMLEDCTTARDERDEAKVQIESLEIEIDALRTQISDLTLKNDDLRSSIEELEATSQAADHARTEEVAVLVELVFDRSVALRDTLESLDITREAFEEKEALLRELEQDILAKEDEKDQLILQLRQNSGNITVVEEDLVLQKEKGLLLEAQLNGSSERLQALTEAHNVLQARVEEQTHCLDALRSENGELVIKLSSLEAQLSSRVADVSHLEQELETARAAQGESVQQLQAELAAAKDALREEVHAAELKYDDLNQQYQDAQDALAEVTQQLAEQCRLYETLMDEHKALGVTASSEKSSLEHRVEELSAEVQSVKTSSQEMEQTYKHQCSELNAQLQANLVKVDAASTAEQSSRNELADYRSRLEETETSLARMEQERDRLQGDLENASAECLRRKLENQSLEKQIRAGEKDLLDAKVDCQRLKSDLAESDKTAKAAQMNYVLNATEHERTIASLKRQLGMVDEDRRKLVELQTKFDELREQNVDMEDVLRAKCAEIEENDDKYITLLKEKKKLASKVESLSKKVQNLQKRLDSIQSTPAQPVALGSAAQVRKDQARPASPPIRAFAPPAAAPSALSTSQQPAPSSTAGNRTSAASAAFGPFTLPRAATPQGSPSARRIASSQSITRSKTLDVRNQPVFSSRTPEPTSTSPEAGIPAQSSSSKKRPAPTEFDPPEPLPAQPIVADDTAPRVRRPLQAVKSGFTPVRGQGSTLRPTLSQPSPVRRTATATPSMAITDVTNSPKRVFSAHPKPQASRGWLGKIRGGMSAPASGQHTMRSNEPDPVVFSHNRS